MVVELFDYQREMRGRIEGALLMHQAVMAQMPTGTGKTGVLAEMVRQYLNSYAAGNGTSCAERCRVLIVAHRIELI